MNGLAVELAKLVITHGPSMWNDIVAFRSGGETAPSLEDVARTIVTLQKEGASFFGERNDHEEDPEG